MRCFAKAVDDDDDNARERGAGAAARARTPPTRPLSTAALLVFASANAADGAEVEVEVKVDEFGGGTARPNSRRTMRSHLRLRSRSSDSCMASRERSSRHSDSFCAIICRRSACLF